VFTFALNTIGGTATPLGRSPERRFVSAASMTMALVNGPLRKLSGSSAQVTTRRLDAPNHLNRHTYGAGTLIIGAVAPVMMAVLATPVWIMFFNVYALMAVEIGSLIVALIVLIYDMNFVASVETELDT
jgi:hypothetical protein